MISKWMPCIFPGFLLSAILLFPACKGPTLTAEKTRTLQEPIIVNRNFLDEYEIILKRDGLIFKKEGHWDLYRGTDPTTVFQGEPFMEVVGDTIILKQDVPEHQRLFFGLRELEADDSTAYLASERLIPLEGQGNLRDLGGIPTTDGRYTSWGKIFRSGKLNELSDRDITYLRNLGLKTIVDLRNDIEVAQEPDRYPEGVTYVRAPIADPDGTEYERLKRDIIFHRLRRAEAKAKFREIMIAFADTAGSDYKPVFDHLMQPGKVPLLFHCSGGKDRTGLMASVILLTLGVDEKTVKDEYLMSNFYRYELNLEKMRKGRRVFIGKETLENMFVVQEAYIDAAFDVINGKYKGVENYLFQKFGLTESDIDWLREQYTYHIADLDPEAEKT